MLAQRQQQFDRDAALPIGTGAGIGLQHMVLPLALQAGAQRALQRHVAVGVEHVHHRLAGDGVGIGAHQFQPGLVGLDQDAFLHHQDGVIGERHHRIELLARHLHRALRLVVGLLQARGMQFARDHAMRALGLRQVDGVAGAGNEVGGHDVLGQSGADGQQRQLAAHGAGGGVHILHADLGGHAQQQLRLVFVDGVRQLAHAADPAAMRCDALPAQQGIDGFHRVAAGAEDDERDGCGIGQGTPRGLLPQ